MLLSEVHCLVLRAQIKVLSQEKKEIPQGKRYAPLAQMVEQLTLNQWVLGSSPRWCTNQIRNTARCVRRWPVGQAAKTTASHAVNGSSILPRVTKFSLDEA